MKSIPGFLGIGGFRCRVLDAGVGIFQGLLGGVVLPAVGKKLSENRLSFLMLMALLTGCVLPAAVIVLLDTYCLGNWLVLWSPCRNNPEQFDRIVDMTEPERLESNLSTNLGPAPTAEQLRHV